MLLRRAPTPAVAAPASALVAAPRPWCAVRRRAARRRRHDGAADGDAAAVAVAVGPSTALAAADVPPTARDGVAARAALAALGAAGVAVYRGATHGARESLFLGHAGYPLASPRHVRWFRAFVRASVDGSATHPCMLAWAVPPDAWAAADADADGDGDDGGAADDRDTAWRPGAAAGSEDDGERAPGGG